MGRPAMTAASGKPAVKMTFRMDGDVAERLSEYSRLTGVPKTFVLVHAVDEYLRKREDAAKRDAAAIP